MIVNGLDFDLQTLKKPDLTELLRHYDLNESRVAVEINGVILKKSDYPGTKLNENDTIEIIHFVGGGR